VQCGAGGRNGLRRLLGPGSAKQRFARGARCIAPGTRVRYSTSSPPRRSGLTCVPRWRRGMRTRVRRFAHVLERLGLAMAGAASGLFVAAHVGSSIAAFTSQAFILVMMIAGAVGFYLGIDTPPQAVLGA